MKAMLLHTLCYIENNITPLLLSDLPVPEPAADEILIKIHVCGVCHTELDEIEGRTPPPVLPVIPGHQIIGTVAAKGRDADKFRLGDRVGVAWIGSVCGSCEFCLNDQENLCREFRATGRDQHGGYAEYMTLHEAFAYSIPDKLADSEAAPLLCAGTVGYRALKLAHFENGQTLGLSGFGASGHLVLKLIRHLYPDTRIYVFTRTERERHFALELGASWAGGFQDSPLEKLHAVIDTTPAWQPLITALTHLHPGGRLVINAIRKEATDQHVLTGLDYAHHLWQEKEIKTVANVTRTDVAEFLAIAAGINLKPEIQEYALEDANKALVELKTRNIRGAKVLRIAA